MRPARTRLDEETKLLASTNERIVAEINSMPKFQSKPESTTAVSSLVPDRSSEVADLAAKNRQLTLLNRQVRSQNTKLKKQISRLGNDLDERGSINQQVSAQPVLVEPKSLDSVSDNKIALAAVPIDSGESTSSILTWLIPFFVIGLAAALYVVLFEESGTTVRTVATGEGHEDH